MASLNAALVADCTAAWLEASMPEIASAVTRFGGDSDAVRQLSLLAKWKVFQSFASGWMWGVLTKCGLRLGEGSCGFG